VRGIPPARSYAVLSGHSKQKNFDSALSICKESAPVPACRGGQSIRFEIFTDDPERASYECGELLAAKKIAFRVCRNATLENGMIEIRATSIGMIEDMPA
jgi:hypothetical protein